MAWIVGVVLINDPETTWFWLNYGKVGRRWIVGLGYHPGDRGSFEQPVLVDLETLMNPTAAGMVDDAALSPAVRERSWAEIDTGSCILALRRKPEPPAGYRAPLRRGAEVFDRGLASQVRQVHRQVSVEPAELLYALAGADICRVLVRIVRHGALL